MKRLTFYGRVIDYSELSHQHLSNILWFNELIGWGENDSYAEGELIRRFGSIRLPYSPLRSFVMEVDALFNRGYITNKHESDIIVKGQWVGKLAYN
jgi:hypothetical protein